MTIIQRTTALAPLLREMAADPRIVEALVDAARAAAPEVAGLPAAENRRHIAVLFMAGLDAFERLTDPGTHDFAEATRLGADRAAQGVPLGALLAGVQACRIRVFEIAIDRGRAAGISHEVLQDGALTLDRYVHAVERHVIDGYHAAQSALARRGADAARTAVLRRLLLDPAGHLPDDELTRLRLNPTAHYHCVVHGTVDTEAARRLERRWSGEGGLFGPVEGRLVGLMPRRPTTVDAGILVVVAPARPLSDVRGSYRLCVAAWQAAADLHRHGLHDVTDLAVETALAGQPTLAGLLSDTLLGGLLPTNGFHRELASTALAYLDHGQRLDQTAGALHVHPNTVRYRLRRMHELTALPAMPAEDGSRLTVPQTMRWWWALHTWLRTATGADRPGGPHIG